MNRRAMIAACAGGLPALALADRSEPGRGPFGLVIHSFPVQLAVDRAEKNPRPIDGAERFLDECRRLGARSAQVGIGRRSPAEAAALRDQAAAAGIRLEGIVSLPRDPADLDRFEAEIDSAKQAGATVVRTVTLAGRRYETFDSAAAFRTFADRAENSLRLAARVVARHGVGLAVENHKDWRADELLALLDRVGNDHLGVCLDTGNSISLLEDPMEVVKALAPRSLTTHFKDMAIEECADGFLLSEVPLGTGILDLERVVALVRGARPDIALNLEMITRDPLRVPCLSDRYWSTLFDLPGRQLARALAAVRQHPPARPLPRISGLDRQQQLCAEDENIQKCLAFARGRLKVL